MIEIDGVYNPKNYEKKLWDFWMEQDLFHAEPDPEKTPYTILMPPPNVTSQLHMGHGLGYTIQDLFIRWKRMLGFNACWLPGTDHAGIATQMMVERSLEKEGKSRKELGREAFVDKCHEWKAKYGGLILEQFASMGFSCDWDRVSYTMDPSLSKAVRYVFVKLYEEGLIYRGERLVNWDTKLLTALSDDEVENQEIGGHLFYYRYPVEGSDRFIPIATTRPETMLGDTAVAVNPNDERFKDLIGKNVILPFTNRAIPIIADDYVKSEFGTGAVKITPAHDPNDFEMGKRHKLPFINIMNEDGTLNDDTPERFRGMDRFVARKEIIKALDELELFDKKESYKHSVPHSERSKTVIEPRLSHQWFVNAKEMAALAASEARDNRLKFYPDSWKKTYLYWLDNIQDWCISRQLWWGHRIPIWYCEECNQVTTGVEDPTNCSHCQSSKIRQDEDVLDTWFSSWLWPLSPFGWPSEKEKERKDLEYFYPTDVLVTAPEIIFLWVARMVMVGVKYKKEIPFKDVYFNATVCDKKGRKFSKTLNNGIDPLEVIEKHGADAVRYTAVSLAPLGGRVKMAVSDFENGAHFINKLWNAARFLLMQIDENSPIKPLEEVNLSLPEKWLITEFKNSATKINNYLSSYRVNEAIEELYHFIWKSYCDWGVETAKEGFKSEDDSVKSATISTMVYCFDGLLRLAHPIIPFVTEEIWQKLPHHPNWDRPKSICVSQFPEGEKLISFDEDAKKWETVQSLINGIRSARTNAGLSPKEKLPVYVRSNAEFVSIFSDAAPWINRLCNASEMQVKENMEKPAQSLSQVGIGFEAYIPVGGVLDIEKERKRLEVNLSKIQKGLDGIEKKLSNENFVKKAPQEILDDNKARKKTLEMQKESILANLETLV